MRRISLCGLALLLLTMPSFAEKMQTVMGAGSYVSKNIENLSAFNAVEVRGDAEVDFMQMPNTVVTVSGRENLVSLADIRVEKGVLIIGFTRPVHIRGEHHLRIAVSAPELTAVSVRQRGEFEVRGSLHTSSLALSAEQDGEITMDFIQADQIEATASGRADIELSRARVQQLKASVSDRAAIDVAGLADQATFINEGHGEIDADNFHANKVNANNYASGKIKVYATEALYAQANGRGKIEYKGNPRALHREGNLRKIVQDRDLDD